MASILFEKPLLTAVLGAIAAVVMGFVWLQTGRRQALYALVLVLLATALGIFVAGWVVTDRERVDAVLRSAARAVEQNDLDALLALVHSDETGIREQIRGEFPHFEFYQVKIKSNLEITFDNPNHPTEAVAKFNVVVTGSERSGFVRDFHVPRYCIVTFRKDGEQWRVYSYQHSDPRDGLMHQ